MCLIAFSVFISSGVHLICGHISCLSKWHWFARLALSTLVLYFG